MNLHEDGAGRASCIVWPGRLAWLALGLLMGMLPVQAAADLMVTNVHSLRLALADRERCLCHLDLVGDICGADPAASTFVIRDDSGVELCRWETPQSGCLPGRRIHLALGMCELIRRPGLIELGEPPVVDDGGIHSAEEKSSRIHLEAGFHSFRLFYLNAKNPAELEATWSGPGFTNQPLGAGNLFLEPEDSGQGTAPVPGVSYFCYNETPSSMDEALDDTPSVSGKAPFCDIERRNPEEFVAMIFKARLQVHKPGEYEFRLRSDDGSELYLGGLHPEIQVLVTNLPIPIPNIQWPAPGNGVDSGQWISATGVVQFAGLAGNELEMDLAVGDREIQAWVPDGSTLGPALLVNATLQVEGVLHQVTSPGGRMEFEGLSIAGPQYVHIQRLASEQWDKYPLASLEELHRRKAGNFIAHLRGRLEWGNGRWLLAEGGESMPIQLDDVRGWTNGADVEVLGSRRMRDGREELSPAYCRSLSPGLGLPSTLTMAAQVQQLSASEAARGFSVHIRGVVTSLVEWHGATVQDDTRGVFCRLPDSYRDGLEAGDFVDLRGVTGVGDFAPVVEVQSLNLMGPGRMPVPVRPNYNQLISGSMDVQYVEVRGIITGLASNTMTLLTDGGKINVEVHGVGPGQLQHFENTLVRIRGCLLALWNSKTRQVQVGMIKIHNAEVQVDQLPPVEPFSAPAKSIGDLLRFDLHASGFQRVRVSGQIVHMGTGDAYLMADGRALRFVAEGMNGLALGDFVDVVGIPELGGPEPVLHEAVVRRTGHGDLPAPMPWPDAGKGDGTMDGLLVGTEARLISLQRTGQDWLLELQTGLRNYRAEIVTADNLAGEFPLGSRLHITGVYVTPVNGSMGDGSGFELLLNRPHDIQLLQRPPWWTLRRLFFIVAALVAVLAAASLWITQLRRKVEQRTRMLEREHSRREQAERMRALEAERSRIARDLHDDLGSSLTEIRVMASTGLRGHGHDGRSNGLFKSISQKAHNLVSALDVIVWAVDPEANSLQSLADYLGSYVADYLSGAGIACRFRIPVSLPMVTLDGRQRHELFLAVKEIIHNIVQHSKATEVGFHLRMTGTILEIEVEDNGCGFDPARAMEAGRGLKNIPERLQRLGGSADLKSNPGRGTIVCISLDFSLAQAKA